MKQFVVFLVVLLGLTGARETHAHGMRTAYVELVEHTPGQAILRFRTTVKGPAAPEFPAGCTAKNAATDTLGKPLVRDGASFLLHCDGPLAGRDVGVMGLGTEISEAIVWVSQYDGTTSSHLLSATQPKVKIPSASAARTTLTDYMPLGVKHIFAGADHLLF